MAAKAARPPASARPPTWTQESWQCLAGAVASQLATTLSSTRISELLRLQPELEAAAAPARRVEIVAHLRRLTIHYPLPVRSVCDEALRWDDWCTDLAETPVDIIAQACAIWRRSRATKFPTPGQFLEITQGATRARSVAVQRLAELRRITSIGATDAPRQLPHLRLVPMDSIIDRETLFEVSRAAAPAPGLTTSSIARGST